MTGIDVQDIHCLLVDLDDTLYPHANGVWEMLRVRIDRFMLDQMGFSEGRAKELRARYFKQYGTTLRGLQVEHSVNMADYLAYVHDVPLESVLTHDPELDALLQRLPQRKVIFTNADANHAHRVMDLLGVASHFEAVVDIHAIAPYCKPAPEAFHKALSIVKEKPENCMMVDDSPANLSTAKNLGIKTVSVGPRQHDGSPHIETIHHLVDVLGR